MDDLTYAEVAEVLAYDTETGKLYWKPRPASMFPDVRICNSWNTRYAGTEAFTSTTPQGYKCGAIFDRRYQAQRVAWILAHGEWPKFNIDHLNGDKTDNRKGNMRDVNQSHNQRNTRLSKNNTSGANGVYLHRKSGLWHARIWVDRKVISLGYFHDIASANAARIAANIKHGYTERHGQA